MLAAVGVVYPAGAAPVGQDHSDGRSTGAVAVDEAARVAFACRVKGCKQGECAPYRFAGGSAVVATVGGLAGGSPTCALGGPASLLLPRTVLDADPRCAPALEGPRPADVTPGHAQSSVAELDLRALQHVQAFL
jgi:hypothetical protein